MVEEHKRERCDRIECGEPALFVMKVYTNEGPYFVAFCQTHMLSASQFIEGVATSMIEGVEGEE